MGGEPRLHPGLELLNDGAVEIQAVLDLHEAAVLAEQLEHRGLRILETPPGTGTSIWNA